MAVAPTRINADGSIEVVHDDHGGTVKADALQFAKDREGKPVLDLLVCPCPGCDAVSFFPVSGGHDPEMVQRLFAHRYIAAKEAPAVKTWEAAVAEVAARVAAQDGPERFKLAEATADERTAEDIAAKVEAAKEPEQEVKP